MARERQPDGFKVHPEKTPRSMAAATWKPGAQEELGHLHLPHLGAFNSYILSKCLRRRKFGKSRKEKMWSTICWRNMQEKRRRKRLDHIHSHLKKTTQNENI